jgi:mannonate dehydratase
MTEGNIYEVVDHFSRQRKIAYVHLRNVHGKAPQYRETFVDDGDVAMIRVLNILRKNRFNGVVIPDHTPQMECAAPWHAGMAPMPSATYGLFCKNLIARREGDTARDGACELDGK